LHYKSGGIEFPLVIGASVSQKVKMASWWGDNFPSAFQINCRNQYNKESILYELPENI
jgi:hypothetical protein